MIKISDIPKGNSRDDIKAREEIISSVYRDWYGKNPSKKVFNSDLKDFINVRFISITETIRHASKSYYSTLAVMQLDTILRSAVRVGKPKSVKSNSSNQSEFAKMQIMECNLIGISMVKLTVGIKKSGMKIQYCITALKA